MNVKNILWFLELNVKKVLWVQELNVKTNYESRNWMSKLYFDSRNWMFKKYYDSRNWMFCEVKASSARSRHVLRGQGKFCESPPRRGTNKSLTLGDFQNIFRMIPANVIMKTIGFPPVTSPNTMFRTSTGKQNTVEWNFGCQNWMILGAKWGF